ncbi:sensor histidine kinase [Streptomyces sp. NPDC059788]|uniref:sensor histidine kinase n=1 Tax=Streptomyces sp. NPDC059788 TaxID=3346948 RepID=UPI00364CEAF9
MTVGAAMAAGSDVVHLWWVVPAMAAAFLAGRRTDGRRSAVLVPVALATTGMVASSAVSGQLLPGSRSVAVVVAVTMLAWFAGRFRRRCRQLAREGWERAEQLVREQQSVAERARLRERARIAQDMHDVIGHDLSLIALSAGTLKLAPGLDDHHRRAAGDIRSRAAAAVERLGEVIGVLRTEADDAPDRPPGSGLASLAAEASASGLLVELHIDGDADALSTAVERVAHRVVQEALTNIAKHAPGAEATVRVTHTPTETRVVVVNGPPPRTVAVRPPGGGRGLAGLGERVRSAGGSFHHGPYAGGFAVAARIPRDPPSPPPGTPDGGLLSEHRRARRRVRRSLAAMVVLPVLAGALLGGARAAWEVLSVSRSVLEPGDRARLYVGQARSEAERFLPDRQTGHRPPVPEPKGQDTTCEYYAMTAAFFGTRREDAYRLCFRDGTLVSLDALTS